jgi:hypothetical protein
LLINTVPVECINIAAIQYQVPAKVIIAVLKTEGGKVGQANLNKNGTIDYGPMQINSIWLPIIAPYGYTAHELQNDPCINVAVGTWILAQSIAENKEVWTGIGNYHSHTYALNVEYQQKVNIIYEFIERALAKVDNKNKNG